MVPQETIDYYQKCVGEKLSFLDGRSEFYANHSVMVLSDNVDISKLTHQIAALKAKVIYL